MPSVLKGFIAGGRTTPCLGSGMIYGESRYLNRGKFAKSRFEEHCLAEYAEVFKTVCLDAVYYTFSSRQYLQGLASQVPRDFKFGFKVTDAITVKRFPNLPRFGARKGTVNENFLNADVFASRFLEPCEAIRSQVGILMFEFSRVPKQFEGGFLVRELLPHIAAAGRRARHPSLAARVSHVRAHPGTSGSISGTSWKVSLNTERSVPHRVPQRSPDQFTQFSTCSASRSRPGGGRAG